MYILLDSYSAPFSSSYNKYSIEQVAETVMQDFPGWLLMLRQPPVGLTRRPAAVW